MSTTTTIVIEPNLPWCETSPPHPSIVGFYWAIHCLWILNFLITATGTYKIFTTKDDTSRLFKMLWISVAILFTLSPPGFAFGFQSGWECWYGFVGWEAITMIGVNSYLYGLALLNLFFIMRLKTVFSGTPLRLKRMSLTILSICICIQFLTPIISTYYLLSGWNAYVRAWGIRYFVIFTFTNIISSIIVLVLFVRKMLLLPSVKSNINASNRKDSKGATRKRSFLNLVMKYIVCATFATVSTFIIATFGIVRSEFLVTDIFYRGLHCFTLILDSSVNLICLYLQFPFGLRLYKTLCNGVHSCFEHCFIRVFALNNDVSEHMDYHAKKTLKIDNKSTDFPHKALTTPTDDADESSSTADSNVAINIK